VSLISRSIPLRGGCPLLILRTLWRAACESVKMKFMLPSDAQPRLIAILSASLEALGADHPSTLATVYAMAVVFHSQGQYDKALEWYERALAGRVKSMGANHPRTQSTIRHLIDLHERCGRPEQAQSTRTRLYASNEPGSPSDKA